MYEKILIVVESDASSRAAIHEGVALAKAHDAEVVFFSVLPRYVPPMGDMPMLGILSPDEFDDNAKNDAERLLARAMRVAKRADVRCTSLVGNGADDAQCVAAAARKQRCGLIVVSEGGHNAVVRLLTGSVVPGLITHARVPVLVCPNAIKRSRQRASATP